MEAHLDLLRLTLDLGGNKATIERLLKLYLTTTDESLAALEQAHHAQDIAAWKRVAHHIKGSSKNITAARMGALAAEAEALPGLPDTRAAELLTALQGEITAVREEIGRIVTL